MNDDESSEHPDAADVFASAQEAISDVSGSVVRWVQGLPRLYQLVIGAIISVLVQAFWNGGSTVIEDVIEFFPTFTTPQLLIALIGVVIMQTFIQTRRFNRLIPDFWV